MGRPRDECGGHLGAIDVDAVVSLTEHVRTVRRFHASITCHEAHALDSLLLECRLLRMAAKQDDSRLIALPEELLLRVLSECEPEALVQLDCTCSLIHSGGQASLACRVLPNVVERSFGTSAMGRYAAEVLRWSPCLRLLASLWRAFYVGRTWVEQGAVRLIGDQAHDSFTDSLTRPLILSENRPVDQVLNAAFAQTHPAVVSIMFGDHSWYGMRDACRMPSLVMALVTVLGRSALPAAGMNTVLSLLQTLAAHDVSSALHSWTLANSSCVAVLGLISLIGPGAIGPLALATLGHEPREFSRLPGLLLLLTSDCEKRHFVYVQLLSALRHVEGSDLMPALALLQNYKEYRRTGDHVGWHLAPRWFDAAEYAAALLGAMRKPANLQCKDVMIDVLLMLSHGTRPRVGEWQHDFLLEMAVPDANLAQWFELTVAAMNAHPELPEEAEYPVYTVVSLGIDSISVLVTQALWGYEAIEKRRRRRGHLSEVEALLPAGIKAVLAHGIPYLTVDGEQPASIVCAVRALRHMVGSPAGARCADVPLAIVATLKKFPMECDRCVDGTYGPDQDRSDLWAEGFEALGLFAMFHSEVVARTDVLVLAAEALAWPHLHSRVWDSVVRMLSTLARNGHPIVSGGPPSELQCIVSCLRL